MTRLKDKREFVRRWIEGNICAQPIGARHLIYTQSDGFISLWEEEITRSDENNIVATCYDDGSYDSVYNFGTLTPE